MAERNEPRVERLSERVAAYLQPPWGLGLSNAGVIASGGEAVLVDTLFDLGHTRAMLGMIAERVGVAGDRIGWVVNTHHNGDHCWGNQLLPGAKVVAHRRCREFMPVLPPQMLAAMVSSLEGTRAASYLKSALSPFDFSQIELRLPTVVFDDALTLFVGDDPLELIYVGPAHTAGDIIAYFPRDRVVFAGDVVFRLCTPIGWEGTFAKWIAALDKILSIEPDTVVPGHGPVCGREGVEEMRAYLGFVFEESRRLFEAGVPLKEAVRRIDPGPYGSWSEPERVVFNVARAYRELNGKPWDQPVDFLALAELVAELAQPS